MPARPTVTSLRLATALLAAAGLAACASSPPDPGHDPLGTWVGALVTDDGTCPTQRNSTLQISKTDITFTPGDGAIVLRGKPGRDPHQYHAQYLLQDANHHPFPFVFNGMPVGQAIGGIYGTPTCRAHVTLTRG